jgi:hypothetical protein
LEVTRKGEVASEQGSQIQALTYWNEAFLLALTNKDYGEAINTLGHHLHIYKVYFQQTKDPTFMELLYSDVITGLRIAECNNVTGQPKSVMHLRGGTYWMYKEDFTQALEQFALALEELSKSNPKPSIQAEYLGHYGQALAKSGHTEGFAKLKEALQIIRTHRDLRPFHQLIVESGILLRLADAYISRHDLDNARSYLKEAKPLVDELAQEHGMEMRQNQFHNLVQSTKLSLE